MRTVMTVAIVRLPAAPSAPARGIVRRHDQPDDLYLQLAREYSTAVHLNLPMSSGAAD